MLVERTAMRRLSKPQAISLFILAALGAGVAADLVVNDGRFLTLASGRAGVEEACLPELRKALADRGFSPSEIELGQRPGLGFTYRANRTFTSDFTFEDGPEATRIDGIMECELGRNQTRVSVRTGARPLRAT